MSFRKEEKLKIHKSQLVNLLEWIYQNGGVEIHNQRVVSSTYFDNDEWRMFHDSEEGSVPRKKIRIRSYTKNQHKTGTCALEIKTSSVEGRFKTVRKEFDLEKLLKIGFFDEQYGVCKAKLRVSYLRTYYKILGVRLTIDQNIEYATAQGNRTSTHKIKDTDIIVEIKAADNIPNEFLNRNFPYDRIRFSKYSRAVNCLLSNSSNAF